MARLDTELTQAALDCARAAFGRVSIVATATLRNRPGWSVELALVTSAGARSVIAKTARARERAALEVITDANVPAVPRLLAACDDPALVLIEDAGPGASVAVRRHSRSCARSPAGWAPTQPACAVRAH